MIEYEHMDKVAIKNRQELQRILSTCLLGADICLSKRHRHASPDTMREAIIDYLDSDFSLEDKNKLAKATGYFIRES